ncbi:MULTISPECIES: ESX secretion-associated protein EspG [Actinosynnema]|uniref:ESX secretion-associated protein EspG n=1 Tax=Actinosynnema TaxID=40566 RepID=UPI0020A5E4B0|nr:ESX secretion-associated protein EspG [Actinosynnema pretiosum]MCP2097093.1 EspG family protein [Actinosynnema pretiosum]
MLHGRVVLPAAAVYVAWQAVGLGELHRALIVELDFDDAALAEGDLASGLAAFRDGWAALEAAGFARGREVRQDLARALQLVADPGRDYYAFFNAADERTRSAVVSVSGQDALRVVVRPDKHLVLEPVRPEDAVASLVSALPQARPGRGRALTLPLDALEPAAPAQENGSFLQRNLPSANAHEQQVRELRKLLAEPRAGGGQLFSTTRDRTGRRVRSPRPLTFFDTPTGRYLQFEVDQRGTPWMTVQPADFGAVVTRLGALPTG